MPNQVKNYRVLDAIERKRTSFEMMVLTVLLCLPLIGFGQTSKIDTVYYVVDTARVPAKDRLFEIGDEGNAHYYSLTCQCFPGLTDPVFTYVKQRSGQVLNATKMRSIKTSSVSELIKIAARFGSDKILRHAFYFIEPRDGQMIMNKVNLLLPQKRKAANSESENTGIKSNK
jgi:hypothetical protein